MAEITLSPYGGPENVAKLCNMKLDATIEQANFIKQNSHTVSRKHSAILRKQKFESDRKTILEQTTDNTIISRIKNTSFDNPKEWVVHYCCSNKTIPNKWYVRNLTSLSRNSDSRIGMTCGYSYEMPWLYNLFFSETIFEKYIKFGPRFFMNENGVTPSTHFVNNNPKYFFTDEELEEPVPAISCENNNDDNIYPLDYDDSENDEYESDSEWVDEENEHSYWDQPCEEYL